MIDKNTIQHIAKLARINLTPKEEEKMKQELSSILGYIEKLNQVNTERIEPLYQIAGLVNSVRSDDYRRDFAVDENLNKKLIDQAPEKEEKFIKVKSILNK